MFALCAALVAAGALGTAFAFTSVNLFSQAMASAEFVRKFGWTAIRHGALVQMAQLMAWGLVALGWWMVFKVCETELSARYRAWAERRRGPR